MKKLQIPAVKESYVNVLFQKIDSLLTITIKWHMQGTCPPKYGESMERSDAAANFLSKFLLVVCKDVDYSGLDFWSLNPQTAADRRYKIVFIYSV